ncbi:hypothetical protein KVT40_001978 [Elsinoe batatas]|uniref:Uncharacterized protein n=1 Tax=Elsinoe batatas TaxID=2601811 RepID=A0A8K0PLV1_9PEZI|nr:hypothetical protein KVT40_001978 [Elsinoe batatas]
MSWPGIVPPQLKLVEHFLNNQLSKMCKSEAARGILAACYGPSLDRTLDCFGELHPSSPARTSSEKKGGFTIQSIVRPALRIRSSRPTCKGGLVPQSSKR